MLNSEPICVMTKIAYLCLLFTLNDRPFYNRTNIRSTGSHLPGLMNFSNTGAFYLSLWMGPYWKTRQLPQPKRSPINPLTKFLKQKKTPIEDFLGVVHSSNFIFSE